MKGDFSRLPFQSDIETKHYGAVLDQQGRVKTDYDKAVEVAIESHLRQQRPARHHRPVGRTGG